MKVGARLRTQTYLIFTNILTRRLPKTVKAQRRVFLYDNSCNMHKHALRRGSKEILNFKLFTDRHHWKNHVGCSESWDPFFRKDTHCLDLYQNIYFSNATIFQIILDVYLIHESTLEGCLI